MGVSFLTFRTSDTSIQAEEFINRNVMIEIIKIRILVQVIRRIMIVVHLGISTN